MKDKDINYLVQEFTKSKKDFYALVEELESLKVFKLSQDQFDNFNEKIRKLSFYERKVIIDKLISRSIYHKLKMQGYRVEDIKSICQRIAFNWNEIVEKKIEISIKELIEDAKLSWELKEKELKQLLGDEKNKAKNKKRKIVGAMKLLTSGGIFAIDSASLAANPTIVVFYASFWAGAAFFHTGIDQLLDL